MPYVSIYLKQEFPPLLPMGRHVFTLADLRLLCVDGFPSSPTRDGIMNGLEIVVELLSQEKIVGDLWVNGSFLTKKNEADDADLVLCMDSSFSDNATPSQQEVLMWFEDKPRHLKRWLKCHCFPFSRWPIGHMHYWLGEYSYAYWMRQWGFSQQTDTPKGIAVIELR